MSLAQVAFGDLEPELAATRRVLERLPEARFDYRPHEKAWNLGELASHTARVPEWGELTLHGDSYDMGASPQPDPAFATQAELLAAFDAGAHKLAAGLKAVTDEALQETWSLKAGDQVFFSMPRLPVLRSFVVNHLIHHRGQLTVYLRAMGEPVPSTYGPTADEAGPS